jgi:hypothetical protein
METVPTKAYNRQSVQNHLDLRCHDLTAALAEANHVSLLLEKLMERRTGGGRHADRGRK